MVFLQFYMERILVSFPGAKSNMGGEMSWSVKDDLDGAKVLGVYSTLSGVKVPAIFT